MNFKESLAYLLSLGHEVLAAKYGLESTRALLQALGNPQNSFKSVLVAGTNGKGSLSAMLDSVLRAAGHRVALYTSPHLVRIQERMRVDSWEIDEADFARIATGVRLAAERLVDAGELSSPPTFFEQITAIALKWFSEQSVQIAVLEVGLGGRLDATNTVDPILSVIASIDYDHQNLLGDTIESIATEKAAIIKPGVQAVIGRQRNGDAVEVLMRRCLEMSVLPAFANEPALTGACDFGRPVFNYESSRSTYSGVLAGLRGRHQADNAAAVIESAELLNEAGFAIPREALLAGLRDTKWPGRLELVDDRPAILLDGAHNPAGAHALRLFLEEYATPPLTMIFAAMKDKDIDGMGRELFDLARTIVLTQLRDPRGATGPSLARPALVGSHNVIFTETVRQALSWARSVTAPGGLICVAGSLYLIGELKRLLEEDDSQHATV